MYICLSSMGVLWLKITLRSHRPTFQGSNKQKPMGPAVELWKETEIGKVKKKYERLNEKIVSWEDKKKKKAKIKLHRTERGVERRKLKAMQRLREDNERIEIIVESARADAYESRMREELRVKEKANLMRRSGTKSLNMPLNPATCRKCKAKHSLTIEEHVKCRNN